MRCRPLHASVLSFRGISERNEARMKMAKRTTILLYLSCLAFLVVLTVWVVEFQVRGYLGRPGFLRMHLFYWLTNALLAGITVAWLARMVRHSRAKERVLAEANRELNEAQERIKKLICLAEEEQSFGFRFENPNLVKCYELKNCDRVSCPVYGKGATRCWQVVGTHCLNRQNASWLDKMRNCPECIVYQKACPDKFTELAEDFNNMMAMLQRKAEELATLRRQAVVAERRAIAGEIAAGLAHEINNPLDGLKNCILRIRKNPSNTVQTAQYLDLMMEALTRIEKVMAQLLDLTRGYQYHFAKTNLNRLLDSTLTLLNMKGRAQGVAIHKAYDPSLPQVEGDATSLQQVFLNLELNALAAMPQGGTLLVKTYADGNAGNGEHHVHVEIKDTGRGIPPENMDKIFNPFFTTKEPGTGTGLGLSISRNIVEEHKGEIWAESQVGVGTAFTVRLPVRQ